MTTFRLESRFQQSIPHKNDRAVKLDHHLVTERLLEMQHPAVTSVPVSRNEYLDRRAKLWSLIQGVTPQTANLEEIAAEKAALDAYQLVVIIGGEGVDRSATRATHGIHERRSVVVNTRSKLGSRFKELNESKSKVEYQSPQSGRRSGLCLTEKRHIKRSKHLA